jgi:hypothetical protein
MATNQKPFGIDANNRIPTFTRVPSACICDNLVGVNKGGSSFPQRFEYINRITYLPSMTYLQ